MTVLEFILPALVVILLSLPLIKVFTGKVSVKSAKIRLATHVARICWSSMFSIIFGCCN